MGVVMVRVEVGGMVTVRFEIVGKAEEVAAGLCSGLEFLRYVGRTTANLADMMSIKRQAINLDCA